MSSCGSSWRSDGTDLISDFDGENVGEHTTGLWTSAQMGTRDLQGVADAGYWREHSDVHLWYHGTIVPTGSVDDRDEDGHGEKLTADEILEWYGGTNPSRTESGYYFSRIAGGHRTIDGPKAGLSARMGGAHADEDEKVVLLRDAVWPNILNLAMDSPDVHVHRGTLVHFTYWYQDYDSNATTTFYLDRDQNPYNGNEIATSDTRPEQQTGAEPWTDGQYIHTDNAHPDTSYSYTSVPRSRMTMAIPGMPMHRQTDGPGNYRWQRPQYRHRGLGRSFAARRQRRCDGVGRNRPRTDPAAQRCRDHQRQRDAYHNHRRITITPAEAYYGNFTPGQSKLPDNLWHKVSWNFTLPSGQTKVAAFTLNLTYEKNDVYYTQTLNFTKEVYGQGDHWTFTVTSFDLQDPSSLCDRNNGDGIFQTSEQIYLVPRIQLNGIGSAKNVRANLVYTGTNCRVVHHVVVRRPDTGPADAHR